MLEIADGDIKTVITVFYMFWMLKLSKYMKYKEKLKCQRWKVETNRDEESMNFQLQNE